MKVGTVVNLGNGIEVQVVNWDEASPTWEGGVVKDPYKFYKVGHVFVLPKNAVVTKDSDLKEAHEGVIMPEGKLKVFLKAVANTVIFKVLEQDSTLTNMKGDTEKFFRASNGFIVLSQANPTVSIDGVTIRGHRTDLAHDVGVITFLVPSQADELVSSIKVALKEFTANNYFEGRKPETPESVDPDIFWV